MSDPKKPGGQRSLEKLARLTAERFGIGPRAGRTVSDLQWRPAQSYSIQRDDPLHDYRLVWHAGHCSAILSDDFIVIAAAQTGGVWMFTPVPIPHYRQGHSGECLSDSWDWPDVSSLAYGPDGTGQVFVGFGSSASVILIEFSTVTGGMVPIRTTSIPLPTWGDVHAMTVFTNPRRLVLAMSSGVWWSPIPAAVNDLSGYAWQMGQGLPFGSYSGLAPGTGESVAVAAWGNGTHKGLFRGTWSGNTLTFMPSTISGATASNMRRTSLASSDDHRDRMYAVAAADDTFINAVLVSRDSGATWQSTMIPANHGNLGFYNNCIAVSPYRPDVVALGWRAEGPFISTDAGANWKPPAGAPHTHSDVHCLYFARNSSNADHLNVGSDGGIAVTNDLGASYSSQFNRPFGNLQFYPGTLAVSSKFPGLAIGGTQDNGNIFLVPNDDAGSAWHTLEGGDGGTMRFIDPLNALLRFNNTLVVNDVEIGNRIRIAFWDAAKQWFGGDFGTVVPADGNAGGIMPSALDTVLFPGWRKNNRLMYAMASVGGTVYGFFADGNGDNPALTTLSQIPVATGEVVSALTSFDGTSVFAGTSTGRMFRIDSASGSASPMTLPPSVSGGVGRIETYVSVNPLSVLTGIVEAYALVGGSLVHFDGANWERRNGYWSTFDIERGNGRLFAATDSDVFSSTDGGMTWTDSSGGLPVRPHCSDLRVASNKDGGRDLYLATYGRSVWRATIYLPPASDKGPHIPPLVADALFGVIQDGGGLVRIGGHLHRVPPYPPIRDLLVATVLHDIANGMSQEPGAAIKRTVLQQIIQIAEKELRKIT